MYKSLTTSITYFENILRVLELAPNPPLWLQPLLPPSSPSILQSKYTWVHSLPLFASYTSNGPGNIQPIDIKSEWLFIKINDRTLLLQLFVFVFAILYLRSRCASKINACLFCITRPYQIRYTGTVENRIPSITIEANRKATASYPRCRSR